MRGISLMWKPGQAGREQRPDKRVVVDLRTARDVLHCVRFSHQSRVADSRVLPENFYALCAAHAPTHACGVQPHTHAHSRVWCSCHLGAWASSQARSLCSARRLRTNSGSARAARPPGCAARRGPKGEHKRAWCGIKPEQNVLVCPHPTPPPPPPPPPPSIPAPPIATALTCR